MSHVPWTLTLRNPIPSFASKADIDTVLVDSLKALDPKRPIREADIDQVAVTNRDFMSTRPIRRESEGTARLSAAARGAI